jgi:hypothetical protein
MALLMVEVSELTLTVVEPVLAAVMDKPVMPELVLSIVLDWLMIGCEPPFNV